VFHLPFSDTQVQEEGERAKIFQEITRSCGARLEVSLAKDRGLSILVTGTREEARRARREIVTRLQTQVGSGSLTPRASESPLPVSVTPLHTPSLSL
ncbi:hypothetical protein chiPu_0029683, partial [Chiloscyllium punctatum]|nr:hypothetical protein [Chiloscyllium punctatum]